MKKRIRLDFKQASIIFLIAIGIYAALLIFTGADDAIGILKNIDIRYIIFLVPVILVSVYIEFIRWRFFLKCLNIQIPYFTDMMIFFSGYATGFMPAKSGELIRQFNLKRYAGIAYRRTIPIHFVGALTGFVAVGIISIPILGLAGLTLKQMIIACLIFLSFIFIVQVRPLFMLLIRLLTRFKRLKNHANKIKELYESSYSLTRPMRILYALFLTFAYSVLQCMSLYLILRSLGVDIGFLISISILGISLIIGVVTMIPGGLGSIEGSLLGLMLISGVDKSHAAIAVIMSRFFTLWLLIIVGVIFWYLLVKQPLHKELKNK